MAQNSVLHQSVNLPENKWKVTQLPLAPVPKQNNLPTILDEYNLCNILGYNGQYPWYVVHNTNACYHTFWIDKDTKQFVSEFNPDLNLREISAPSGSLKTLQGRIASNILSKLPMHDCNYAYMSGRNVRHAAEKAADADVLVRIDLKDFFTSHHEPYVRAKLEQLTGYSNELCWFITKLCALRGSLPQGAVTSPILSIVLNYDMDVRISELALRHNLVYTRYADDLCFSGVDRDDKYLYEFIADVIAAIHPFKVNQKKVDIMRNSAHSFVCGIDIRGDIGEPSPPLAIDGYKVKQTPTKITISKCEQLTEEELHFLTRTAQNAFTTCTVRPKRFYMQSIKRMLGMHLTNGIHYPRDKYNKMRVEAMLVGKGNTSINLSVFRGRLAFMRMVDPAKAAKIDAIINKHKAVTSQ